MMRMATVVATNVADPEMWNEELHVWYRAIGVQVPLLAQEQSSGWV